MTKLEHSITTSFTIDHAKQTLRVIIENINTRVNSNQLSEVDKRKLDGVSRYLHNAIGQIDEAIREDLIDNDLDYLKSGREYFQ